MIDTDAIKDLIQEFIKAKRNFRLYPSNNPIYATTVDNIYSKILSILNYGEDLILNIKQYEIVCSSEVAYNNRHKDESFALFFFKDGIREIAFLKGITRYEVEEFLKIVSSDFEKKMVDDDMVTLMWERDFQYIKCQIDEEILLGDENYEETAIAQVKDASGGEEGISAAHREAGELAELSRINIVPLTDEDLQKIIKEMENQPHDKSDVVISILFEMFLMAQGRGEYEEIAKCIKNVIKYSLDNANFQVMVIALLKIRKAREKDLYNADVLHFIGQIDNYMNSEMSIKKMGQAMEGESKIPHNVVNELAGLLNKKSIPYFVALLGELKGKSSKKTAITILTELGKQDVLLLVKGLADQRWHVVKSIIHILGHIADRRSIEHIISTVRHADKRVRKEAVRTLGEFGAGNALNVLKGTLYDEDESVRIETARAISRLDSPISKKIILERIKDSNFLKSNFYEKKEVFKALSQWEGAEVIKPLEKIVKKQTFLKRERHDETRAAAAYCLGLIGDRGSLSTLTRAEKSKNKLLRDHVQTAIKRINDGKS
jgi:hypothetical protein